MTPLYMFGVFPQDSSGRFNCILLAIEKVAIQAIATPGQQYSNGLPLLLFSTNYCIPLSPNEIGGGGGGGGGGR